MPSVKDLVSKFAWTYRLPVKIKDVLSALRDLGVTDEINFYRDGDLDSQIMRGYCTRMVEIKDDGTKHYVTDIHYAVDKEAYREKFVCCKEMLHILDAENVRVRAEVELQELIAGIVLPLHLQEPFKENHTVLTDRFAEIQALAVLFPYNARNVLVVELNNNRITLEDISIRAEIPLEYITLIMHQRWPDIYKHLLPGRP